MDDSRVKRFVSSLQRSREENAAEGARTPSTVARSHVPATSRSPTSTLTGILDPQTLAKIGKLELIAKTVVDGVMSGKHRSTHKGGCSEFSEHRPYAQGDDIRLIDWRIFARRDRYYVKQFEDETNLHAWMIVDASGSMAFRHSTVSKFDYARMACACLARLLLKQRDSIGLSLESGGRHVVVPPRPQANHFLSVCHTLEQATAGGKTSVGEQLVALKPRLQRRGMVLVFSDCFGDIDALAGASEQLRLRGHDVMVFQVLAPEELSFTFRKTAIFEDLERPGRRLNVSPGVVRRRYLERFEKFQTELQKALRRVDCDLETLRTDRDLGDAMVYFLRRRAARRRAAAASA